MGKLNNLSKKRASARKAKAAADAATRNAKAAAYAATAADATATAAAAAAAAAASTAADASADAAYCSASTVLVPAESSGSGSAASRVNTHRSHAAAVANGHAFAGETTSIDAAASVASPSSAATKSLKKPKLFAAVAVLATMANRTGDAILPPAPDLLTKDLKKKSPKMCGDFAAAVGHGATDASFTSNSKYPSRGTGTKTLTAKGASSHPVAEDDAHPIVHAKKASIAAEKLKL